MMTPAIAAPNSLPLHGVPAAGDTFSWAEWQFHPDVYLTMAAFIGLYVFAWRRYGGPANPQNILRRRHVVLFGSGVGMLFAFSGTPLHQLSDYLFSVHMSEHMVYMMAAPPLLIGGTPAWMLRPLIEDPLIMRAARVLTNPVFAAVAFNAVLIGTHMPISIDVMQNHAWAHFLLHALELAAGLVMWWLVVSPMPELPPLAEPWRMGYLFLHSILPTVPASFLTFGDNVLNDVYMEVPRVWGTSAIGDQRVAGLIMKLVVGVYMWVFITVLFFRWSAEEDKDARGLPTWREAEHELERMGIT